MLTIGMFYRFYKFGPSLPLLIAIVLLLFVTVITVCVPSANVTSAEDIAVILTTTPTRVCIAINSARPKLQTTQGDSLHSMALLNSWSPEQEMLALKELHQLDDRLKTLVSPSWTDELGTHESKCRETTETLDTVIKESNFQKTQEVQKALIAVRSMLLEVNQAVISMGVDDFYIWIDSVSHGEKLGSALRKWLDIYTSIVFTEDNGVIQ